MRNIFRVLAILVVATSLFAVLDGRASEKLNVSRVDSVPSVNDNTNPGHKVMCKFPFDDRLVLLKIPRMPRPWYGGPDTPDSVPAIVEYSVLSSGQKLWKTETGIVVYDRSFFDGYLVVTKYLPPPYSADQYFGIDRRDSTSIRREHFFEQFPDQTIYPEACEWDVENG